jgi:thiol peroxidase
MANVKFLGKDVATSGELPKKGKVAPDFNLVAQDLSEKSLQEFGRKKKLLNIFPSFDTKVCAASVRKFYELCEKNTNLVVLNISMDLPTAASRFCAAEGIKNTTTLSAFRSSFAKDYGVLITEGPLKGLCSRSVIVLDEDNHIIYEELVEEITHEPNYDLALKSI